MQHPQSIYGTGITNNITKANSQIKALSNALWHPNNEEGYIGM